MLKLTSVNFKTWLANHPGDHDAKWCRELYPWPAFAELDYSDTLVGSAQRVYAEQRAFLATVTRAFVGENGRANYLIDLRSIAMSRKQQWLQRHWENVFHLVASPDGHFITLFTEKRDPSKELLRFFMSGKFDRLEEIRSLPISGLLFRTLIAYAAEAAYGRMESFADAEASTGLQHSLKRNNDSFGRIPFRPFLSQTRKIWITYSFTEEKAHRLAALLHGAAEKIIVIYCHPTFTKHQRCNQLGVQVLSLSEFIASLPAGLRRRYFAQTNFLIAHMKDFEGGDKRFHAEIATTIGTGNVSIREIYTSEVREAKAGLGRNIVTLSDAAYALACANLLNAALNKKLGLYKGTMNLAKEVYAFKAQLATRVEEIIDQNIDGVLIYIEPEGLLLASIRNVQFSFHNVPKTEKLAAYGSSSRNVSQTWQGVKLQPISPAVLGWARAALRRSDSF